MVLLMPRIHPLALKIFFDLTKNRSFGHLLPSAARQAFARFDGWSPMVNTGMIEFIFAAGQLSKFQRTRLGHQDGSWGY